MHVLPFVLLITAISLHGASQAQPAVQVVGPAESQQIPLAQLAAMPRTTVTVDDHGTRTTFEGVELRHLLAKVGAPLDDKLRGKQLSHYVIVEAADGYRALFALAELDAGFTDAKVILADKRDGKPIGADEGPLRVIAGHDKRMGRSARQATRLILAEAK